jgi:hypothetical protein
VNLYLQGLPSHSLFCLPLSFHRSRSFHNCEMADLMDGWMDTQWFTGIQLSVLMHKILLLQSNWESDRRNGSKWMMTVPDADGANQSL